MVLIRLSLPPQVFLFEKGPLTKAVEAEGVVLLDELNLAPAGV